MSSISEKLTSQKNQIAKSFIFGFLFSAASMLSIIGTLIIAPVVNFVFSKSYRGSKLFAAWFLGQLVPIVGLFIYRELIAEEPIGVPIGEIIYTFTILIYITSALAFSIAGRLLRK